MRRILSSLVLVTLMCVNVFALGNFTKTTLFFSDFEHVVPGNGTNSWSPGNFEKAQDPVDGRYFFRTINRQQYSMYKFLADTIKTSCHIRYSLRQSSDIHNLGSDPSRSFDFIVYAASNKVVTGARVFTSPHNDIRPRELSTWAYGGDPVRHRIVVPDEWVNITEYINFEEGTKESYYNGNPWMSCGIETGATDIFQIRTYLDLGDVEIFNITTPEDYDTLSNFIDNEVDALKQSFLQDTLDALNDAVRNGVVEDAERLYASFHGIVNGTVTGDFVKMELANFDFESEDQLAKWTYAPTNYTITAEGDGHFFECINNSQYCQLKMLDVIGEQLNNSFSFKAKFRTDPALHVNSYYLASYLYNENNQVITAFRYYNGVSDDIRPYTDAGGFAYGGTPIKHRVPIGGEWFDVLFNVDLSTSITTAYYNGEPWFSYPFKDASEAFDYAKFYIDLDDVEIFKVQVPLGFYDWQQAVDDQSDATKKGQMQEKLDSINVAVHWGNVDLAKKLKTDFDMLDHGVATSPRVVLASADISVYPNPSNGMITVVSEREMTRVNVYALSAKLLISKQVQSFNERLDVSSLKGGVYFLEVEGGGDSVVEKILIR